MSLLKKRIEDKTLIITLSDKDSRNAFSPEMASAFDNALKTESYEALVVTAEGPMFCSGGNLRFYKELETKELGISHNQEITKILNDLYHLPVPTVCYIQGSAFGGGVELISCFDWVTSSPSSLFGLWQRRVGLTFGWGGEERLVARMGQAKTSSWLFNAQSLSAYTAKEWGLVDDLQLTSQGLNKALAFTTKCLEYGSENFAKTKQNRGQQSHLFPQLWLQDRHKEILKNFK